LLLSRLIMQKNLFMKHLFSLSIVFLFALSSYAQTGTVKGFVYDKESGEPIIFTNVILKGTSIGIQTDVNGYYSITQITPGNYVLSVSNLTYEKYEKEIEIKANRVITRNIYLSEDIKKLAEFEVSAEAEESKTTIKMSVTKAAGEEIKSIPSIGGDADIAT